MKHKIVQAGLFLSLFLLFFILCLVNRDPDFGWHYRLGSIEVLHGASQTDPFSYTMSSFPFVDHEWLLNIFFYGATYFASYNILAAVLAAVATLAFIVMGRIQKTQFQHLFITRLSLLLIYVPMTFFAVGVRTQVISWFFFAVLCAIVLNKKIWEKYSWLLPLFMLLWANAHGSFPFGIFIIGLTWATDCIAARKIVWKSAAIFLACIAATCINPYGIRLWSEPLSQMQDSRFHWTVREWYPPIASFDIRYWIVFGLTSIIVFFSRKIFSLFELALYVVILLLALSALRHVPFFLLLGYYMMGKSLATFQKTYLKNALQKRRYFIAGIIATAVFFIPFCLEYVIGYAEQLSQAKSYPHQAVSYLKEHMPSGNVFSDYDWGGFLDEYLPEKKVFIDGRMAGWKRVRAPIHESTYAFDEYLRIGSDANGSLSAAMKKYNITTILTKKEPTPSSRLQQWISFFRMPIIQRPAHYESLYTKMKKLHLKKVYADSVAEIYEKAKNN